MSVSRRRRPRRPQRQAAGSRPDEFIERIAIARQTEPATEEQAYALSDRGTYNAFANGKTDLVILFEGEKGVFNPYGVIAVNPKKFSHVRYDLAMKSACTIVLLYPERMPSCN
jgi:hypothetical protein